jgi:hypothetical protein
MKKAEAIKKFFNTVGYPEVTTSEIMALMKADKEAFKEVAVLCAKALGVELEESN